MGAPEDFQATRRPVTGSFRRDSKCYGRVTEGKHLRDAAEAYCVSPAGIVET